MSSPRINYLEGWHKLKRIAGKDVFELVEIFKQEQSEQRNQLTRTRKLSRFSQNQISLEEYARGISAHFQFFTSFFFCTMSFTL